VLYAQGKTIVLCTATVEEGVPRWLYKSGRGWMTAEYAMLPASTGERTQRAVSRGRPDGRTVEIQRLIGRALRSVCDFQALGELRAGPLAGRLEQREQAQESSRSVHQHQNVTMY